MNSKASLVQQLHRLVLECYMQNELEGYSLETKIELVKKALDEFVPQTTEDRQLMLFVQMAQS